MTESRPHLLGIFVGGRGRRMGFLQKALLPAPSGEGSVLALQLAAARAAGCEVVLVGSAELGEHARGLVRLPDARPDIGPLAGLSSLLHFAAGRPVLTLACDMPYINAALLTRLACARPDATSLCSRDAATGKWQALFARHASAEVLPVLERALDEGVRSFQGLFERIPITELGLDLEQRAQLRDWDTPEDMRR
jgi:molybdopterin-guanine dinucleotide biosynthesis protein A